MTLRIAAPFVLPYCLVSGTIGGLLFHLTEKPAFFVGSLTLGAGLGLIRSHQSRKMTTNVAATVSSAVLKGIVLWTCGPTLLLGGAALGCALAAK